MILRSSRACVVAAVMIATTMSGSAMGQGRGGGIGNAREGALIDLTGQWVSVITERIRPEVLAWRSELDSPVPHVGIVRFDEASGGTRVLVRMSYDPPGGALGHTRARTDPAIPAHMPM